MTQFAIPFGPIRKPGSSMQMPVVYFNDFVAAYTGVDAALANESDPTGVFSAVADRGEWLISADPAGAEPAPQDDADGGWVKFNCDGDAGDRMSLQLNGEPFYVTKGRKCFLETRVQLDGVTSDFLVGLSVATTDPIETAPSDYIAMGQIADADFVTVADTGSAGTSLADSGSDLTAATWHVMAFEYHGDGTVTFYLDGSKVARTTTTVPDGVYMSPFICAQSNGAELAVTWDYILVVNERA